MLSNKYYVDELYDATVIAGTFAAGRGLWAFDRNVVDGAVNGSGLADDRQRLVLGPDRSNGRRRPREPRRPDRARKASFWFRRVQTGLVQNYALLMLFGVFAFVSIYLFMR